MRYFKQINWLFSRLHGFLAILFGLVVLLFPSITVIGLAVYFAITIILGGAILLFGSVRMKHVRPGNIGQLFEGIIGIILGIIILAKPEASVAVFFTIIGFWAMLTGLFFLYIYKKRPLPEFERNLFLITGVISFVVGLVIALNPFRSFRVIVILIGIYVIIYGVFSLVKTRKTFSSYPNESE